MGNFNWNKSNYVYGENYLKTKKHLYLITLINLCGQDKGSYYEIYKLVPCYFQENKRLSNTYYHSEGNSLITELREGNKLFCKVNNKKLKRAILKRLNPIKEY